jgi:hypothetical protein
MPSLSTKLQHAWNAFKGNEEQQIRYVYNEQMTTVRPDRLRLNYGNEQTIITPIYNRIATDCAKVDIRHVRLDENGRFVSEINSGLNNCLSIEANRDQTGRAFVQDVIMTMIDEGVAAVVPTDTSINPSTGSYEILEMRVGKVLEWMPHYVKVRLYNENTGNKEDIIVSKSTTALIENPFYAVMNAPNSTFKRLTRKLSILDQVDEQSGAGKLDLLISLPYIVKTEARRKQAEERRKDIEMQLAGSKYGIAYVDSTEKVTQLNRSLDNNIMSQVEYLTKLGYSQLGITEEILNGSASEEVMQNYYDRTIEVFLSAVAEEFRRKFLTKTARSQKQSIQFYRDPFKLVPVSKLADIADTFTRNEILTGNEIRQIVGMKPSADPSADELRNKNLNQSDEQMQNKETYGFKDEE